MANMDYGGYDSDLEEPEPKKPLLQPEMDSKLKRQYMTNQVPLGGFDSHHDREAWRVRAFHLRKMDAYSRHKELIRNYVHLYGGSVEDFARDRSRDRNDYTVLKENHRFLWDGEPRTWEERLAKRYYDALFREYCIADLSRYESKQIAMRWRVEKEVKSGKGQFECGNKHCSEKEDLASWEVNFGYQEGGVKKNALVKLRLCPDCSIKLNLIKKVKNVSKKKKKEKKKKKKRKSRKRSSEGSEQSAPSEPTPSSSRQEEEEGAGGETSIWKGPAPETIVKSTEEEMNDFLQELFL